jgi:hypothetical protein
MFWLNLALAALAQIPGVPSQAGNEAQKIQGSDVIGKSRI